MSEESAGATALTPEAADTPAAQESAGQAEAKQEQTEEKAAPEGAPEAYTDFSIPEGIELDGDAVEGFTPIARDLNLTQAQAQQLVDFYAHRMQALQAAQMEQVANVRKGWVEGIKADEEIGGSAMGEKVALAVKALDRYGNPGLRKILEESGLGDHPEMVRAFYRVGRDMAEDTIEGGAGAQPAADQRTAAEILYPNQGKT